MMRTDIQQNVLMSGLLVSLRGRVKIAGLWRRVTLRYDVTGPSSCYKN